MASYQIAQAIVKVNEGGYSADPDDKGNYNSVADFNARRNVVGTNWGISAPLLSQHLGRPATKADMMALTYSTAVNIYKTVIWDKIRGDDINNQSLANLIYDSSVHPGISKAFEFVAIATGYDSSRTRLPYPDLLIKSINEGDQQKIFNSIKQQRIDHYNKSKTSKYYNGWMNRVNRFFFDLGAKTLNFEKKNYWLIIGVGVGLLAVAAITAIVMFKRKNK